MTDWRWHEKQAYAGGAQHVVGVDEAGRGPLAGPVVAAACFIPLDVTICGVDDSKKLTARQRERLYDELIHHPAIEYAVAVVGAEVIDEINILQATFQAMREALFSLKRKPDVALVDGADLNVQGIETVKIVRGDAQSACIAAASILAKVVRDRLMEEFHRTWPHFRFEKHKGYGTKLHLQALQEHGPCPIHRRSFAPVALALQAKGTA